MCHRPSPWAQLQALGGTVFTRTRSSVGHQGGEPARPEPALLDGGEQGVGDAPFGEPMVVAERLGVGRRDDQTGPRRAGQPVHQAHGVGEQVTEREVVAHRPVVDDEVDRLPARGRPSADLPRLAPRA